MRFPHTREMSMTTEELITKLKTIVKPYIQDEAAFNNLN